MKPCINCGTETIYKPATLSRYCDKCGQDTPIDGLKKRTGLEYSTQCPGDERVVSMVEFKGMVLVATDKSVYELKDDALHVIKFAVGED